MLKSSFGGSNIIRLIATKLRQNKIYCLVGFFVILYTVWSINRHNHFVTDAIDLGIFDNTVWLYSQVTPPFINAIKRFNLLGDHTHFILIFFAPFYWIYNDSRTLLILQGIIAPLGALPIYWLSKEKFKSQFFALSLAFVYLTFVGFQTAMDWDFHEITVGTTFLSFMYYYYFKKRLKLFFLFMFLTLISKENLPIYIAFFGIYLVIFKRDWRLGLTTIFLGGFSYWLFTAVVIPYFKHGPFGYEHLPKEIGVTTKDLLVASVTRPWVVLKTLFYPELKFKTTANLFGSYSFLSLFSPFTYLTYIPILAERFLNELTQRWLIRYQYSVSSDPILAYGVIFSLSNLLYLAKRFVKLNEKYIVWGAASVLLAANLFINIRTDAPIWRIINPNNYKNETRFDKNKEMLRMIPAGVSVQAQSVFVPHIGHRRKIDRYPYWPEDGSNPDYIVMSSDEHSDPPYSREFLEHEIEVLRQKSDYETLFWDGTRLLLKRK